MHQLRNHAYLLSGSYGDTTPRSIQARIYGLIWIVVGITILSVFTATVTTVLTQESLGMRNTIQGRKIGVLNGTDEFRIVIMQGGQPIGESVTSTQSVDYALSEVCPSFSELLDMLHPSNHEETHIRGALVDQYFFASQQHLLGEDMLIQRLFDNPLDQGMVIHSQDEELVSCLEKEVSTLGESSLHLLTTYISPLTTSTASAAESAQTLFQPKTVMYMWYGLGAWVCVFIAFVIWEFVVWRPKHKQRKAIKRKHKVNALSQRTTSKKQLSPHGHKIQNGFLHNTRHARFVANRGFVPDTEPAKSVSSCEALDQEHWDEISSLENLIHWQKKELQELQEEMAEFRANWESKLRELRQRHCAQRTQLLGMLKDSEKKGELSGGASPINIYQFSKETDFI
ncbi:hypothetical protein CAPTEDRAFT_188993 [Capitella teleta]|uniref:Potassium channel domain-containing protein n=1 Tax=Capitella teleta TaxID=283909 RepID=R7ULN5_CAPTE|nr:hypothetical protein CAPTEDRAFT_188993 [Capitella teleta]|eukprot:ELU07100.1 hypothetical protein CAPTEDRAFT_188993 [Capitella teleta]